MARHKRTTHVDMFAHDDFNEQLYAALRRSPWWLTSLMIHGLLLGALLMLGTSEAAEEVKPALTAGLADKPIELEPDVENPIDPNAMTEEQEKECHGIIDTVLGCRTVEDIDKLEKTLKARNLDDVQKRAIWPTYKMHKETIMTAKGG